MNRYEQYLMTQTPKTPPTEDVVVAGGLYEVYNHQGQRMGRGTAERLNIDGSLAFSIGGWWIRPNGVHVLYHDWCARRVV